MKYLTDASNIKTPSVRSQDLESAQQIDSCYYLLFPSERAQCSSCQRDISRHTKILHNLADYCVGCFANFPTFEGQYRIINKLDFPIFSAGWSAAEEILLIEGLIKFGFGNWHQIARLIGEGRTAEEVQEHYTSLYLSNQKFLPPENPSLSTRNLETNLIEFQSTQETKLQLRRRPIQKSYLNLNKGSHTNLQRGSVTSGGRNKAPRARSNIADTPGYLPKRRDFEFEYDNDAELLLADTEFNENDTEEERNMKFRLIEIYNHKLAERTRRKDFVIEWQLYNLEKQNGFDKQFSREEREILNLIKPFARFHSKGAHFELMNVHLHEKTLRQRIEELRQFKRKGFKTLAEVMNELELKRPKEEVAKKKPDSENFDKLARRPRKDFVSEKSDRRPGQVLTTHEREFCRKSDIPVRAYQAVRDVVLRQSVNRGLLDREGMFVNIPQDYPLTQTAFEQLFNFMVERQEIGEKRPSVI